MVAAGCVQGQDASSEADQERVDVCSTKYLADADYYFKEQRTAKQAQTRYKEILEKCPNAPFRDEIEAKILRVDEEWAEGSLRIAMFYYEVFLRTGTAGLGAKSRLKEIVEKMPHYSRISEVKMWLEDISRRLPAEPDN